MKYKLIIGIDTGVNTGWAVWSADKKELKEVETIYLHEAILRMNKISEYHEIYVRIEDARLRKYFTGGKEKAQGVGSVKRDAKILEDFCKDKGIAYEMVAPKNNKTKTSAEFFKKITGWSGRTSEHARDAAMLCFQYKPLATQ